MGEKVEKDYKFDRANGKESLAHLFGECSQLIIYHFMFGPDWPEACKICSMFGEHYDPIVVHRHVLETAHASIVARGLKPTVRVSSRYHAVAI